MSRCSPSPVRAWRKAISRAVSKWIASATIEPGAYTAGDVQFTLDRYEDKYLLRVAGDPEVYVLYVDSGSLGGRVLKFDSGAIAIRVAGWGGMTIYTDAKPTACPRRAPATASRRSLPRPRSPTCSAPPTTRASMCPMSAA